MPSNNTSQTLIESPLQLIRDLLLIFTGSIFCSIAVNGILVPQHFVTGGITGLSLIIHKNFPSINLGSIYFLINLPLFALAWMSVGRRFFFYSVLGTLSLVCFLSIIHPQVNLDDKMLNALLAGLILGAGAGITLRSSGSQGGIDILSIMLLKRFSISIGNTILTVNVLLLCLVGYFYSLDAVLYTLITLFVSSKVINLVVTGLSQRKAVLIISTQWKQISKSILEDINRGVTIIEGRGGYSGSEENILYTIVTFREIIQLKRLVQHIDPDAFVVISDTLEVMNYRIGNQPHW